MEQRRCKKERTPKQIQTYRRNFMLMQLRGMQVSLTTMRDVYVRAYFLKGMLNVCIATINNMIFRISHLSDNSISSQEFNNKLLEVSKCETWHQLFNSK